MLARCCSALLAAPLVRQRLPAHRSDPHSLLRLRGAGLEHHDGLCRPAVARPRALCRARRLHGGGALRAFRHRRRGSGCSVAVPVAMACGAVIGFLAFRFGVAGVYFAILTIAFAEFARIGFDHFALRRRLGRASSCRSRSTRRTICGTCAAGRSMFYYVMLALTVAAFLLCHALLRSRIGYFWLAIREDEQAARALGIDTFRYKMFAVVISAGMTAVAGVFFAFYYNNLFPEQVFHISRSIELILAPIIGGIGTLFGPILGAFVLTGLSEGDDRVAARARLRVARRQAGVLRRLPAGRGDGCCRTASGRGWRAGSASERDVNERVLAARVAGVIEALPRAASRSTACRLRGRAGRDLRRDRPERRRQDHAVQHDRRRAARRTTARSRSRASASTGCAPDEVCRRGIARTFQIVRPFPALTRRGQRHGRRAAAHRRRRARARARAHEVLRRLDLFDKRARAAKSLTLPDRKRLEVARALATAPQAAAARRGDGRSAPDRDRPHGGDPARAQCAERAHHPADRARDARRDGARAAACWCCITARRSRTARRQQVVREPAVIESYLGAEAL